MFDGIRKIAERFSDIDLAFLPVGVRTSKHESGYDIVGRGDYGGLVVEKKDFFCPL